MATLCPAKDTRQSPPASAVGPPLRKSVREVEELSLISAGLRSLSRGPKADLVLGLLHIFDPLFEGGALRRFGLFEKFLQ